MLLSVSSSRNSPTTSIVSTSLSRKVGCGPRLRSLWPTKLSSIRQYTVIMNVVISIGETFRSLGCVATSQIRRSPSLVKSSKLAHQVNYDIAWKQSDGEIWIAEIKSITSSNEEKQLRLGLGQVLRYCQILKTKENVRGVIVIERAPSDLTWIDLCEAHNILLVWPEVFTSRLRV